MWRERGQRVERRVHKPKRRASKRGQTLKREAAVMEAGWRWTVVDSKKRDQKKERGGRERDERES